MLGFVLQKIRSKKWLMLSLLLGNLLIVAIAAAGPMYSQASMQRALTQNLSNSLLETNKDPGIITVTGDYKSNMSNKKAAFENILRTEDTFEQMLAELNVPVKLQYTQVSCKDIAATHQLLDDKNDGTLSLSLYGYSDLDSHITITKGRMYSKESTGNVIEVIVNERTYFAQHLMLDEELTLPRLRAENGEPYKLKVVGIFQNSQQRDAYWLSDPTSWLQNYLVDYDLFRQLFANAENPSYDFSLLRCAVLDYTAMESDRLEYYIDTFKSYDETFDALGGKTLTVYSLPALDGFLPEFKKLNTTVWVLLAPILALLIVFIFMVSGQMLEMEQNEIAIFKSRGAGSGQVLWIYLLQSLCISGASILGGVPLGYGMCRMLGASNSFLEFVQRASLPLEISLNVWLFAFAAALCSVCAMVVPVFRYTGVSIVAHKRQKNRAAKKPLWQMLFGDVLLLAASVYILTQYKGQQALLAQQVQEGSSLDPLLYICSSLFMVGAALLVLRVFPWLVKCIYFLGKKWWSPALYTSFLRIVRTRGNQGFMMVFLILTVSMGIFNARTARTINTNSEEKIRYITGADIVLQEKWSDNSEDAGELGAEFELSYVEPDFQKYLAMDGVQSATKVLVDNSISVSLKEGELSGVTLMGINTKEFGQTAWLKEGLLPHHFYDYLNVISQNANAILVSSNFMDDYGYKLGDVISYQNANMKSMRGVIYGFVDYWPGYAPFAAVKGADGRMGEKENHLIVAHLEQLQTAWGVTPYQVWINAKDSTQFIYDYATEQNIRFSLFKDTTKQLVELKNDPVFQGTNSILTIGFICILMLCAMGFLIYWILSIQSRTLQFGIFRAMGMSMREVFSMLINEQVFITGVSLGAGILVGAVTSELFVPLVQIAYSSADQVLPLYIVSHYADYLRLFAVIGFVILVCMAVLGMLISRIKISQALKLGED